MCGKAGMAITSASPPQSLFELQTRILQFVEKCAVMIYIVIDSLFEII